MRRRHGRAAVAEAGAASFGAGLVRRYGTALGAEQIRKGQAQRGPVPGHQPPARALLGPVRGEFGEDPYLTSQMAVAEVKGLQSQHVIATTKTSRANNQETYRLGVNLGDNNVSEYISPRALNEIYCPASSCLAWRARSPP